MTGDPIDTAIVQPAAQKAAPGRARLVVVSLVGALFVASLAVLGVVLLRQGSQIDDLRTAADENASDARRNAVDGQALAEQVRRLGAVPVVTPAPPVAAAPASQPRDGAPGVGIANVEPGVCVLTVRLTDGRASTLSDLCGKPGVDGQPGQPGQDGQDGKPGQDAPPARGIATTKTDGCDVVVVYTDDTSDRLGPFCGPPGADGRTPDCMAEATQCRGADGQPPAGWTTSYPSGASSSCSRASPFDPESPRYVCTYSAASPPSPSPTN